MEELATTKLQHWKTFDKTQQAMKQGMQQAQYRLKAVILGPSGGVNVDK